MFPSPSAQFLVGELALLCAISSPQVWAAVSLPEATQTPTVAFVIFVLTAQHTLGGSAQGMVFMMLAAVAGGVLGLGCMYLVYAINGRSYAASHTKDAAMVVLVGVGAFGITLLRFKSPRAVQPGNMATKSLAIVALAGFHLPAPEPLVLCYYWLQVALGAGTAFLAAALVFPVTAASRVQAKTTDSLARLGRMAEETLGLALALPLRPDGRPADATGDVRGPKAVDAGLEPLLADLTVQLEVVLGNIEVVRRLLSVVSAEWTLLRRVGARRALFPKHTYALLLTETRSFLTALQMLVHPLQSGKMSLADVQRAGPELSAVAACLRECMDLVAACLGGQQQYAEALPALVRLEAQLRGIGVVCGGASSLAGDDSAALTLDMVVAGLFLLGTRVRSLFFLVPEALRAAQPGARAHRAAHFKGAAAWDLEEPQGRMRARALALTACGSGGVGAALGTAALKGGSAGAGGDATSGGLGAFPAAIPLPLEVLDLRERAARALERAFRSTRSELALALQVTAALCAATVLHVNETTYSALHKRTIWIVVTTVVIQETEMGGVVLKAILRVMGTVVGGGIGLGFMGLAAVAGGGTNQFPKYVVMCLGLPLVSSLFFAGRARWPAPYGYFFSVVLFTAPMIALSGYEQGSTQWDVAWYRLLMVLIGIGLTAAVQPLLFPRTAVGSAQHRLQAALTGLSHLADTVLGSFVAPERGFLSDRLPLVKVDSPQNLVIPGRKGAATEERSGIGAAATGAGDSSAASSGKSVEGIEVHAAEQSSQEEQQQQQPAAPSAAGPFAGASLRKSLEGIEVHAAEQSPQEEQQRRQPAAPSAAGTFAGASLRSSGAGPGPAPLSLRPPHQSSNAGSAAFHDDGTPRKGAGPGMRAHRLTSLRRHVLGTGFCAVHAEAAATASAIYHIGDLVTPARFDYNPFRTPHRLPAEAITAAKMACRRALNSLLSLVFLFDAADAPHFALLLPHASELQAVVSQTTAILLGLSRLAARRCALETCFVMTDNLIAQVAHLVLAVEADVLAQQDGGVGEADVVLGLAALGVLQTTCVSVQLILAAVVGIFCSTDERLAAAARLRMGLPLGGAAEALLVVQLGASRPAGLPGEGRAALAAGD